MHKVTSVRVKPGYVLVLRFEDGTEGEVSVADRLFGPMFEPLKDPELFAQVRVDKFGAVCWPNEADLAPDALYQKVRSAA
jgi:glycine/D-amino acid oxidase-like deaminating enzyme